MGSTLGGWVIRVWGRVPVIKTGLLWLEDSKTFAAETLTWAYEAEAPEQQYSWVEVDTDENGFNDNVMLVAFCQVLQLQPGESPFYADYGIPSIAAVQGQTFPDMNVYMMQQRYAPNFVSLVVTSANETDVHGTVTPVYNVVATTHTGAKISAKLPR